MSLGLVQMGLGMPADTKKDEFSEKFQTAFDPPHLRKIILQTFWGHTDVCALWYNFNIKYIPNSKRNLLNA